MTTLLNIIALYFIAEFLYALFLRIKNPMRGRELSPQRQFERDYLLCLINEKRREEAKARATSEERPC